MSFVSADVNVTAPGNGTNWSGLGNGKSLVLFNVSFLNNTDILISGSVNQTNINATFYLVNGSTFTRIGNSSECAQVTSGTAGIFACWGLLNISSLNQGIFNYTVQLFNLTGAFSNSTRNATDIRIDTANPRVAEANFTNPLTGRNYSSAGHGIITLNVSISEDNLTIGTVYFNITNSTGGQNATYTATQQGSTVYWNATFNTTHFPDGVYNITVWANDTAGNLNNSARVYTLRFDNTKPTATFSCTPTPIDEGDKITCSCSVSDSTAGVNSSATSFTTNPSTTLSGEFTETCSFADLAANTNSATTTYRVTGLSNIGSGGGGGGGGSGGGTTVATASGSVTIDESQLSSGYSRLLDENQKITVGFSSSSVEVPETHTVTVTKVESNKVTIVIASHPISLELIVNELKKVDVDHDNTYDLSVKLNSIRAGKADITVQKILEPIPQEQEGQPVSPGEIAPPTEPVEESKLKGYLLWLLVAVIVAAVVVAVVIMRNRRNW